MESVSFGHESTRPALPVVAFRHCRRPGRRGRRPAQGHGVRNGGRSAGGGWALHRLYSDGDLRAARLIAGAQRQFHHHPGDPDRHATRPGRPRRRSGEARDGDCGAHRAGRRDAGGGAADAPGIRRQLHVHARADGLQGRHRPRDRPGPGAEAPRDSHHEGRIRPRSVRHRAAPAHHFADHAGRRCGDVRGPDRHGATEAAFPCTPGRRGGRHRGVVVVRSARRVASQRSA